MSIDEFNKKFKVGSKATYQCVIGISKLKTVQIASEAYRMNSGDIVVNLKGMAGCFSIEHIGQST